MRARGIGHALAGGLGLALSAMAGTAAHDIDPRHLPLGDGKLSSGPKRGYIWACRVDPHAAGAFRNGPWIDAANGTFDITAKAVVRGAVAWNPKFAVQLKGDQRFFTTNDLPAHPTGSFPVAADDPAAAVDRNPNRIGPQAMQWSVPANPAQAVVSGCAPGAVGVLLSGAVLFNALDAPGRDAVAHEVQDACQGHPQESGVYHYHSLTSCLPDKRLDGGHSALVGYALDGFGIFGSHGEGGVELASADLDECHGHVHTVMWDGKPRLIYHYHATRDFPYTVGCLRGAYSQRNVRLISGPPPRFGAGPPGLQAGGPPGRSGDGPPGGPPDLNVAAAKLGIPMRTLRAALGPPPPDLAAAAERLGIGEDTLRAAPERLGIGEDTLRAALGVP